MGVHLDKSGNGAGWLHFRAPVVNLGGYGRDLDSHSSTSAHHRGPKSVKRGVSRHPIHPTKSRFPTLKNFREGVSPEKFNPTPIETIMPPTRPLWRCDNLLYFHVVLAMFLDGWCVSNSEKSSLKTKCVLTRALRRQTLTNSHETEASKPVALETRTSGSLS